MLLLTDRRLDTDDMQIESGRELKEEEHQGAEDKSGPMEDVFKYPKSYTMTAEELARHRQPKRTHQPSGAPDKTHFVKRMTGQVVPTSSLQAAAIAESAPFASEVPSQSTISVPVAFTHSSSSSLPLDTKASATNQVKIEQDDEILMDGMHEVWHGSKDTEKNDDDSSVVSLYSATALPNFFPEDDDSESL